ncbi:hypothetical protein C2845_PM11G08580 [Panicum miliaceum]|uniref:Uncharacterized protein n=1 Tax=Panicum miliaceum TaxID=4540 RepID=A0A3L6RTX5_PANMI|nr:hypothetical protein C2845_PM11G08580 [Panicum miliaceum]
MHTSQLNAASKEIAVACPARRECWGLHPPKDAGRECWGLHPPKDAARKGSTTIVKRETFTMGPEVLSDLWEPARARLQRNALKPYHHQMDRTQNNPRMIAESPKVG